MLSNRFGARFAAICLQTPQNYPAYEAGIEAKRGFEPRITRMSRIAHSSFVLRLPRRSAAKTGVFVIFPTFPRATAVAAARLKPAHKRLGWPREWSPQTTIKHN